MLLARSWLYRGLEDGCLLLPPFFLHSLLHVGSSSTQPHHPYLAHPSFLPAHQSPGLSSFQCSILIRLSFCCFLSSDHPTPLLSDLERPTSRAAGGSATARRSSEVGRILGSDRSFAWSSGESDCHNLSKEVELGVQEGGLSFETSKLAEATFGESD